MQVDDRELTEHTTRLQSLLGDIESIPDPSMRARTEEIVQGLVLFYGEGLSRLMEIIHEELDATTGPPLMDALTEDELVAHLLLLHDLHPVPVETRVLQALEQVRPYLQSHGGNVELLGIEDGVARLRLQGSCSGCPSSTMTLKLAIEEAIARLAPDLDRIEAEGVTEPRPQPLAFLPTSEMLKAKPARTGPTWTPVNGPETLVAGDMQTVDIAGQPALFVKLDETLYAYTDTCPHCDRSLADGAMTGTALTCPGCNHTYDIRAAGRCIDTPDQHLEPIPLLVKDGAIKVAMHG
jgi:Fe-S cluster biogenesis protein NfuA/nitrite reductase/ring-hydroxylating ferredoxin subunit